MVNMATGEMEQLPDTEPLEDSGQLFEKPTYTEFNEPANIEPIPWDAVQEVERLKAENERLRAGIKAARDEFCGDMIKSDLQELWDLIPE